MSYSVGDTVTIDGIESVIIYDNGSETTWGRYILVDKNHDLSYYIRGTDYVDQSDTGSATDTHFAEWGGYGTATRIDSQIIGDGLSNTNSLIEMDLGYYISGWPVLWDWVEQFRSAHLNKWFVPTLVELEKVYSQRAFLENLSTTTNSYYWTSSESSSNQAYIIDFSNGYLHDYNKFQPTVRVRLCRYTTDFELNPKTIQITSLTENSFIYYTTNNSAPSESSTLYTTHFEVNEPLIIKARGYKEGWIPSNISVLDLNTGETSEEIPENINQLDSKERK